MASLVQPEIPIGRGTETDRLRRSAAGAPASVDDLDVRDLVVSLVPKCQNRVPARDLPRAQNPSRSYEDLLKRQGCDRDAGDPEERNEKEPANNGVFAPPGPIRLRADAD